MQASITPSPARRFHEIRSPTVNKTNKAVPTSEKNQAEFVKLEEENPNGFRQGEYWARSMRGQANEAWALYKIKSTLGSLGSLGISLRPNFDSLGTTVIPRRNANNGYVKFVWGVGGTRRRLHAGSY